MHSIYWLYFYSLRNPEKAYFFEYLTDQRFDRSYFFENIFSTSKVSLGSKMASALQFCVFLIVCLVSFAQCTKIALYSSKSYKGNQRSCPIQNYDTCYNVGAGVDKTFIQSWVLDSDDTSAPDLSVTLYEGQGCNGKWERWSFHNDYRNWIAGFQSTNPKFVSIKLAKFKTSTTTGYLEAAQKYSTLKCQNV